MTTTPVAERKTLLREIAKSDDVDHAKTLLESKGYVVIKAKSHQKAQQNLAVAKAQVDWAEHDAERAREWARNCLDRERRLAERCTYLYGLAASLDATREQLAGH